MTKMNNNNKKGIEIIQFILCAGVINQLNQSYNSSHHELNSAQRGVAGDLYCICSVLRRNPRGLCTRGWRRLWVV